MEQKLLERVHQKAEVYGQNLDHTHQAAAERKIRSDDMVRLYQQYIIPLTKKVEIDYLLQRLDGLSPDELARLQNRAA